MPVFFPVSAEMVKLCLTTYFEKILEQIQILMLSQFIEAVSEISCFDAGLFATL